ncbi:MAG: hypothetical protein ACREL4_04970 [Gemmatimonadales bacterium]
MTSQKNTAAIGPDHFATRHIGPRPADVAEMLATVGYRSLDELIDAIVPAGIRLKRSLALPAARSESEVMDAIAALAARN